MRIKIAELKNSTNIVKSFYDTFSKIYFHKYNITENFGYLILNGFVLKSLSEPCSSTM